MGILQDFEIQNKIYYIVLDNIANNNVIAKCLQQRVDPGHESKLFHLRCIYHKINLIVQTRLKIISPSIQKVRLRPISFLFFIF